MDSKQWVDWTRVRTMFVIATPGFMLAVSIASWQFYQDVAQTKRILAEHLTQYEVTQGHVDSQNREITQIKELLQKRARQAMLMTGQAQAGSFGGSRPYVQVNTLSSALIYEGESRVVVTKLGREDRVTHTFPILGSFESDKKDVLIRFSAAASDMMGSEPGESILVLLQPDPGN